MILLDERYLTVEASPQRRRDARYDSVTSSVTPLITKHETTFEHEIVDEYFKESEVTEDVSESNVTVITALSTWDPLSDSNRQRVADFEIAKSNCTGRASSPGTPNLLVTYGSSDMQSTSESSQDWHEYPLSMTDGWTTNDTNLSGGQWTQASTSSESLDHSLDPLLQGISYSLTSQSANSSVHKLGQKQPRTSARVPRILPAPRSTNVSIAAMEGDDDRAIPLPSSTLLGRAPYPSTNSTNRARTITTNSSYSEGGQYQLVLRKSTEDMIKLIYQHRSSARSGSAMPFHEPLKHGIHSKQNDNRVGNDRKSVQWQDQVCDIDGSEDMSDILDAYLGQEPAQAEGNEKSPAKVSRRRKLIARNLTVRDHEKAAARKIFRRTPDWQNLDKISKFLRVTKDLSTP